MFFIKPTIMQNQSSGPTNTPHINAWIRHNIAGFKSTRDGDIDVFLAPYLPFQQVVFDF